MNVYAHLTAFDLHCAIADALPDLTDDPNQQEKLAATGTDGRFGHRPASEEMEAEPAEPGNRDAEAEPISRRFGHHLATEEDGPGRGDAATGGMGVSEAQCAKRAQSLGKKESNAYVRSDADVSGSAPP
jgi:hypothetical protein